MHRHIDNEKDKVIETDTRRRKRRRRTDYAITSSEDCSGVD